MKKTLTDNELRKAQRICNPCVKRLYTLKEASEYMGRSVWGVRDLIWSQAIPVIKQDGGRKMYLRKRYGCIHRKEQSGL